MPRGQTPEPYQRSDGTWAVKLSFATGDSGERVQRRVDLPGAKTKTQAKARVRVLLVAKDKGEVPEPETTTVAQWWEEYLRTMKALKRTVGTVRTYSSRMENHVLPKIGTILIQKLHQRDVQVVYNAMSESGLTSRTVHSTHLVVRAMLQAAKKQGLIARNPADRQYVDLPEADEADATKALDARELNTLLAHAKESTIYAPIALAAYTGMRIGEVCALRWADVDLTGDNPRIHVRSSSQNYSGLSMSEKIKCTKSGKPRWIPIPAELVAILDDHRREQFRFRQIWGSRWQNLDLVAAGEMGGLRDKSTLGKTFGKTVEKAGVKPITFHGLRHTFATIQLLAGNPITEVSRLLGHKGPHITLKIYAHVLEGEGEKAQERFAQVLRDAM